MSEREYFKRCPIENTLKHLGKKWSLTLLRDLFFGPQRFTDLLQTNTGITTKVLSQRLKDLEEMGLIKKHSNGSANSSYYEITEKGETTNSILVGLADYSIDYHPEDILNNTSQDDAKQVVRQSFRFDTPSVTVKHTQVD